MKLVPPTVNWDFDDGGLTKISAAKLLIKSSYNGSRLLQHAVLLMYLIFLNDILVSRLHQLELGMSVLVNFAFDKLTPMK